LDGGQGGGWYYRTVHRLEPGERLGELLFGLIMVLTFTLRASLRPGAMQEDSRDLLLAALGCNAAWGIIDAILQVAVKLSERGRINRLIRRVHAATEREEGLAIVSREIDRRLPRFLDAKIRAAVHDDVFERARHEMPPRTHLELDDVLAGLAIFWLIFLTTLPTALPFLLLHDQYLALRVSNVVLILMLFYVGWRWASYTGASHLRTSLVVAAICLILVAVSIALGG